MKSLEDMTDHELLMELVAEKRRQDKLRYAKYALIALVVIVLCVGIGMIISKINEFERNYQQFVGQFDGIAGQFESMEKQVNEFFSTFNGSSTKKMQELMQKIADLLEKWGL